MRRLKTLVFFIFFLLSLIPSLSIAYDCTGLVEKPASGTWNSLSMMPNFQNNGFAYIFNPEPYISESQCRDNTVANTYNILSGELQVWVVTGGSACPPDQYRVLKNTYPTIKSACVDSPPPPDPTPEPVSCSNGLADTNENGIDCGGSCAAFCAQVCPEGFNLITNVQTNVDECSKIVDADQWGQCPMGWAIHPANGTAAPWCELIVPSVPGKADEFSAQPAAASATPPAPQTSTGSTSTVVTNNTTNNTSTVTTTTKHTSYGGNVTTTTTSNTYSGPDGTGQLTSSTTESKTGAASPTDATQGTDSSAYSTPGESSPYGDGSAFDVGQRFQTFVETVKSSALFSMAGGFAAGIPSGGESTYSFSGGRYGEHTFDFSRFSSVFTMIRALYLIMCSWVAIKIVTLKGGSQ